MLLLFTSLAFAGVTTSSFDKTDTSEVGEGTTQCSPSEAVEAVAEVSISLPKEAWLKAEDLEITIEGHHKNCRVRLIDLELKVDGEVLWSEKPNITGDREGKADWHIEETYAPPDVARRKLAAGSHTLAARLAGTVDTENEKLRVRIKGKVIYGRDWDDDGFDDDQLAGGNDCDDDDDKVNPGVPEKWYDDFDQNCDGKSDFDQDGDGFDSEAETDDGEDCDDLDEDINPGVEEIWYDEVDDNCDGNTHDRDGDGQLGPDYPTGDDCDDQDASVFRGSRNYDDQCKFTVRDDDSRPSPDVTEPPPLPEGCDCASAPSVGWTWLALLGALAVVRRRR